MLLPPLAALMMLLLLLMPMGSCMGLGGRNDVGAGENTAPVE
jgi:hypothetical protein